MVKALFNFGEGQGWIDDNPGRKMRPLKVKKGNRTPIFTDKQYEDILDAAESYTREHRAAEEIKHWPERVPTFIELLRWSAMDPIDAIEFRPESITGDVLRCRRQKTCVLATVKLPQHVIVAVRSVPLAKGCTGDRPFRTRDITQGSNVEKWGLRQRQTDWLYRNARLQRACRHRQCNATSHDRNDASPGKWKSKDRNVLWDPAAHTEGLTSCSWV